MINVQRINALANVGARAWGAIANFVFLPLYVSLLGPESFGLVTFFATFQISLMVAFTGWTKALRRQFAIDEASQPAGLGRSSILKSFQVVYGLSSVVMFTSGCLLAYVLSRHWLRYDELTQQQVFFSLVLMAGSIASQLMSQAFSSALHGMQMHISAVIAEIAWSLLRAGMAVFLSAASGGSVIAFFLGFLLADVAYAVVLRVILIRPISRSRQERWSIRDVGRLKRLAPLSAGLTIVAVAYLFNTQIDRLVISRFLGLEALGAYNVAAALGQVSVAAATALAVTAFPIFVSVVSRGDEDAARVQFHRFMGSTAMVASCLALFLIAFRREFLTLWLGDDKISFLAIAPTAGLILGGYFLALQQIPYEFLVSKGITRVNVVMSMLHVPWTVTVTPFAVVNWGLMGAAFSWALLMGLSTLGYSMHVYKVYVPGASSSTPIVRFVVPVTAIAGMAFGLRWVLSSFDVGPQTTLIVGILGGAITLTLCLLSLRWQERLFRTVKGS